MRCLCDAEGAGEIRHFFYSKSKSPPSGGDFVTYRMLSLLSCAVPAVALVGEDLVESRESD